MFKCLLKKYIFVLCASMSSTACLAMDSIGEDLSKSSCQRQPEESLEHGSVKEFSAISLLMRQCDNPPLFLSCVFKCNPNKIKLYEEKFDEMKGACSSTIEGQEKRIKLETDFLEALFFLDKSDKKINSQLDVRTLEALSARYWRVGYQKNDLDLKKKYMDQAIWCSMMSAKADCGSSYSRLCTIIDGKMDNKTKYLPYYTFLIPLVEAKDEQARALFTKVLFDSTGALSWIEKYIEKLTKSQKSPTQLEALHNVMGSFKQEKGNKAYNEALQLWKNSPHKAIELLLEAKDCNEEAKEKLAALRQSKGYKTPKKVNVSDHGKILKELDTEQGSKRYQAYCIMLGKASKVKEFSPHHKDITNIVVVLSSAAELGNPEALKAVEKIKKSAGYKDSELHRGILSTDLFYCIAYQYRGFTSLRDTTRSLKTHLKHETSSQTSPPQNMTTNNENIISKGVAPTGNIQGSASVILSSQEKYSSLSNKKNFIETSNPILTVSTSSPEAKTEKIIELQHISSSKEAIQELISISSVSTVPQKIEEQIEMSKIFEPLPGGLNEHRTKDKKKELLPIIHHAVSDQAPNQSQEESHAGPEDLIKSHRTLKRTQSLANWPTTAKPSEEPLVSTGRKPMKRTLSLTQISSSPKTLVATSNEKSSITLKKNKTPSTKMSLKTFLTSKKKQKKASEEKLNQSISKAKTSPSQSKSEEQISHSEESVSTSKEKTPFSKLVRALQHAHNKSDVKLTEATITSTLNGLPHITWVWEGNTISATHNIDPNVHLTLHAHDGSDKLWFKKPENVEHFLWFVGKCHEGLEEQIYKIGKK
ncbi:MAG: hypothetical protein H0X26_00350 [Alphaproteobacteria bacterium]|nr:hypothetical protein [Alphaproteobacteria bacterium]